MLADRFEELIEKQMLSEIRQADRADQRKARRVLKHMLVGGSISRDDLALVTTIRRGFRKPLERVTVFDLIQMGLLEVER